jgi:GNAT superfamily N-acetyltransferase
VFRHARTIALLLRRGAGGEVWKEIRTRVSSSVEYAVLCRDLSVPFSAGAARIPLRLRRLRPGDEQALLDLGGIGGDAHPRIVGSDLRARLSRRRLLARGIGTPYVAVTADDRPVYLQWLFLSPDNDALAAYSHGFFPPLRADEAIVEGIFTIEEARGQGVMSWALAELARLAAGQGVRRILMFVATDNIPSLRGCHRAGFVLYGRQYERWRLFRRSVDRPPLAPPEMPRLAPGGA